MIDFDKVITHLLKESGDGTVYIVGNGYREAEKQFSNYMTNTKYDLLRIDKGDAVIWWSGQEGVVFSATITDATRKYAEPNGDMVIDIEDTPCD